uniref:Uncharacterized protein n=1 Tax=Tanacetum cinerariifolium TaxID=118510 RepID=A0A6L2LB64_TANCI|nr:hypothetical protein [Tanacetum cinerariifolium]
MCSQDKESEEDTLIDILKTLMEECKVVYKETSSRETNKVQRVSFIADDEEGDTLGALPCQLPPKELNPGSFTFPSTIGNLNLHAMEDLEASVNVMPKSIFEKKKLASLKETSMVQRTQSYDNESVDTLDSPGSIQGLKDNHKDVVRTPNLERIISRWHVCKPVQDRLGCSSNGCAFRIMKDKVKSIKSTILNEWVMDSFDVEVDFGKTQDDPYLRRFDEYKEQFDNEIEQLASEYDLRVGRKKYALEDMWGEM